MSTQEPMQVTRDNFLIVLNQLHHVEPTDYDGMTLAEITQNITLKQLDDVFNFMGVM